MRFPENRGSVARAELQLIFQYHRQWQTDPAVESTLRGALQFIVCGTLNLTHPRLRHVASQ